MKCMNSADLIHREESVSILQLLAYKINVLFENHNGYRAYKLVI